MSSLQKIIQHQVGVKASLYTNELGASNSKINNTNVGVKHDSYQRRLNELKRKQKDNLYARQYKTTTPLIGNKTESYEIVSRGLTPEKFLNCSFNDFINHFGLIEITYNNFTSLTNYPKTLTLTDTNQAYDFETYKDDLFAMTLAYIGVLSIIAMFLPKDNIFNKIIKEISEVFKK